MKFIRLLVFSLFLAPFASMAASSEFTMAAQLLAAAKAADIQQVQSLVNAGANVNFVDSTGVSIVCTALMNNDTRAAQILQMYGADASKCDRQIKQYNNRNKTRGSGGLFSGLSSVQTISLAAAGAAVVVGGLLLLTDVFDPGNKNENSSGGDRPNNNDGGEGNGGAATAYLTVPYSPAYLGTDGKITTDKSTYLNNLASWEPTTGGVRQWDFNYFRPDKQPENNYFVDGILVPMQNYLLMMHGYSAFANEYMGQEIFRDAASRNPVLVSNDAGGGRPIITGLITANGINPTGSAGRGDGLTYTLTAAADATPYPLDKYFNYNNPTVDGLGTENTALRFDLSGAGTAMNPFASAYDSALGKIIAGWSAGGRSYGDLFGFVPNGRLGVFRVGAGKEWGGVSNPTDGAVLGTVANDAGGDGAIDAGDTIVLNGVTYSLSSAISGTGVTNPTITINGTTYRVAEESTMLRGVCVGDDCADVSDIAIYVGTDGYYYVNSTGGDTIDAVYTVKDNNIYAQKELIDSDYKNFEALAAARSISDVLANVSVIDVSRDIDYVTVKDMPALLSISPVGGPQTFITQIDSVYERKSSDATSQGAYANLLFNSYSTGAPILVMPAGEFEYGAGAGKSLSALDATFENYAPLLYGNNLEHMFMTVVAVGHSNGTAAADSITGYANGISDKYGPLYLSMWTDFNGTLDDDTDNIKYQSRKCGVAGVGANGIDPWCFAAAGPTAEMATASAAGAVASLKGAFSYMSNPQIFMLMALTADGYLLGTDASGTAFNEDTLANYLREMYALPPEYYADSLNAEQYLKAFADVYGYGLINLERAMTPNKKIYFFDGNSIVSANGNAYWRAASNTVLRPSTVLSLRGASISAPYFDVLESVDGKMRLPRVWENSFALAVADERALYMGDVLGDLKTRRGDNRRSQIGNIGFSMAVSERSYDDGLSGLENLRLDYATGNWNFGASYQRYLVDGASRFDGMANPVLGLASNAVVSDIEYEFGKWSFGVRAFSGAITDEGLLENDPTISAQYMPTKLGLMQGGQARVAWSDDDFKIVSSFGFVHETDTLLGAYTDGLLNLGNGDTAYVDVVGGYSFSDAFDVTARATMARTVADSSGWFVLGLDDIYSNSFALGANIGNFEFVASMPLAITRGALQYAHAEYEVEQIDDNNYELNIRDAHIADLSLGPQKREVRFAGTYRHSFGEFTDGAIGFIYRVNPNHTDDFGNESVFMLKLSHRLGI